MSSSSQGDEARRALIEDLELAVGGWAANQIVSVGFAAKNWRIVLAALRAEPVRAAEEMTVLDLARAIDNEMDRQAGEVGGPWLGGPGYEGGQYVVQVDGDLDLLAIAAAIRALSIQPAAEGGADE